MSPQLNQCLRICIEIFLKASDSTGVFDYDILCLYSEIPLHIHGDKSVHLALASALKRIFLDVCLFSLHKWTIVQTSVCRFQPNYDTATGTLC